VRRIAGELPAMYISSCKVCWCGYQDTDANATVAVCFRAPAMVLWLTVQLGAEGNLELAEQLFDRLVLRGRIKPNEHGLWTLDTMSDQELRHLSHLN
jgi:hypothetical protein